MSEKHIKINEIYKADSIEILIRQGKSGFHALLVRVGKVCLGNALARKNIAYLTDRDAVKPLLLEKVEHSIRRRLERKISAVGGSFILTVASDEGTGDNSAHSVLADEYLSGNTAIFVKCFIRDDLLVRRDLKNAVCRGIDDEISRFYVLVAVIVDDRSSRIWLIAKHSPARSSRKFIEDLLWKSVGIGGHRLFRNDSRYLPMSCRGVLTLRRLGESCDRALLSH